MEPTPFRIRLLGELVLELNGRVVPVPNQHKLPQFLAYLAYFRGRHCSRDELIELLWPEASPERGRASLNNTVYQFRKLVKPLLPEGRDPLASDVNAIALPPELFGTDLAEFHAAEREARRCQEEAARLAPLQKAVELYLDGGDLLHGCYEEWISPARQSLEDLFLELWRQLLAVLERTGDYPRALLYARRALLIDRLNEDFHYEVIRLLMITQRFDEALQQAEVIETYLADEFGEVPGERLRSLIRELQRRNGESPATAPLLITATPRPDVAPTPPGEELETPWGTVPLGSRYYLARPADPELYRAIARREPLTLLKGSRQVGKSSLVARGLQQAREDGCRVAFTSLRALNSTQLESPEAQARCLAAMLYDQLEEGENPADRWHSFSSPNQNLEQYVRRSLRKLDRPLVWALDEVDRLFESPFGSDIFGLLRTWSQYRSLDPDGPWERLVLLLSYSTEPHLFIRNLDQSPFNVGIPLELSDFTRAQVEELNSRYGCPLDDPQLDAFHALLGGHPYLVRTAFYELVRHGTSLSTLLERAADDTWIFGDHLRRLLALLGRDPELPERVQEVLAQGRCSSEAAFYRLRSAGLLAGGSAATACLRTRLYARYLQRQLA